MTPVNRVTIKTKLEKLDNVVKFLKECGTYSRDDFLKKPLVIGAAERYLILAVEVITDIGGHILSKEFYESADSYEDIIKKLGKHKIVPKSFAQKNASMAGFRNLLIHEYIKIDLNKVYDYLQKAPDILTKFAKYYIKFLDEIK